MNENFIVYVYASWSGVEQLLGRLYVESNRGRENYSFEYDEKYLQENNDLSLDPDLYFYQGRQYVAMNKPLFGVFADSCPDRWGRMLLQRREAYQAKREVRRPKKLTEMDYLLGVYDEARLGALRFKRTPEGEFLANDSELAIPPWTTLRKLEYMSQAFESGSKDFTERWLEQLLAPGSSLGGARPKATVQATDKSLWIAKFPSKHDEYDMGAWEMVVHDLAVLCGLDVPEARLEKFSSLGSTFLVKRFDRDGEKRIHFSSAMTLLGKVDGAGAEDGSSYLDLASFIRSNGSKPAEDLLELWKRVAFNVAVANTDDHLRNHGFILTNNGWHLSPMYDVNASIYGDYLSLNITDNDASLNFENVISSAKYYDVSEQRARSIVEEMKAVVSVNWEKVAKSYGINRSSIEYMRPAFEMDFK